MYKRIICLTVAISVLLSSLVVRTGYICLQKKSSVEKAFNSYSLVIDNLDYQLYYSNGERITNNEKKYVAVIRPNEKCIGELHKFFSYTESKAIIEELSKGYPITVKLDKNINAKYIQTFEIYDSNLSKISQLISKSSSGVLKYTKLESKQLKISFSVDAKGRMLAGDKGSISKENYDINKGTKLTIDKKIQSITYNACRNMKSGCAIVMDVKSGNILSCVTKPDDCFINKCFSQYSVGSVFKIVVACCALENGYNFNYTCNGKISVGKLSFSCQNNNKHGYQGIKEALANSCNCYFINLALALGPNKLSKTAKELGFDDYTQLYDGWSFKNATIPSISTLKSDGQLALLGFGQGYLLSSPVQMCSVICTIGNNGIYVKPKLISNYAQGNKVLSTQNSQKIIEYLRFVVTNGTGKSADTNSSLSAGKTSTAQTGQYAYGNELLNTWFAGIYPYNNPKYAIVVMTENGISGSKDCCPIFRTIVESIEAL